MTQRSPIQQWIHNQFVAFSQSVNAFTGGDPGETFSSRVGRMAIAGKSWALVAEAIIDWCFVHFKGSRPQHCRRVIRWSRAA